EWSGRHLWVATESGLARLDPNQSSGLRESDWVTFTELNGLGRGSVSALDAVGDTVWTATLFDTTVADLGADQAGQRFDLLALVEAQGAGVSARVQQEECEKGGEMENCGKAGMGGISHLMDVSLPRCAE
ncbi:MAG: hypothetical protein HOC74_12895, partial [Gemmatimonadetes bacterium]|nr:hypothetical protein [Gemmatimonadota bacterium]